MNRYATLLLIGAVTLSAGCSEILGFKPKGRQPFPHRVHVLKGFECVKCHVGITTATREGPLHIPGTQTCTSAGCHQKPHDTNECSNCHGLPGARAGALAARENLKFEHKSHMPRAKGNCMRCHTDIDKGADMIRPKMANCETCHNHTEQIVTGKCDPCHIDLQKEGVKPDDHLIHAGNFLREHGVRAAADRQICSSCHAEKFCVSCHGRTVPALPERLQFDNPTKAGVHRAGFKSRHSDEARADPGLCTTCHTTQVCTTCHSEERIAAKSGGKSPHPRGWLGTPGQPNDHGRAAWREPELCAACHSGAGEQLCVGCHKVGGIGGNPHTPGFKSRKSKADRPCRQCHSML
jgi:hypothetical protein